MKRVLMALLFAVAMMASITCYAQITVADLNIGGIYYGMPYSDVTEKLGQPIRMEKTPPAGSAPVFKCGNAEILVHYNHSSQKVNGVSVLSGDGISTAVGIGAGVSTYEDIINGYGQPDVDYKYPSVSNGIIRMIEYKVPNVMNGQGAIMGFGIGTDKKVKLMNYEEEIDYPY